MSNETNMEKYSQMNTEALEALLRQDVDAPEQTQLDADTILQILNILEERKGKLGLDSHRAWEEFQTLYLEEPRERKSKRPKLRRILVLAATITLMGALLLNVGAQRGNGQSEVIATWGDGTFHFAETKRRDAYTPPFELRETHLPRQELDAMFMPTWVPDGYTLEVDEWRTGAFGLSHDVRYTVPGKLDLICNVREYNPYTSYFVNDELEELYHYKGQDYYIFYNYHRPTAIWYRDGYVGNISGHITMEELKQMIHSIGEGEGL